MLGDLLLLAIILGVVALCLGFWYHSRFHAIAKRRLMLDETEEPLEEGLFVEQPFPKRFRWIAPIAGALLIVCGVLFSSVPRPYLIAFGFLLAVFVGVAEYLVVGRRRLKLEAQLVDAIALMATSLQAGLGLLSSFEHAAGESDEPLRSYLQDITGRIRLGENPQLALGQFAAQVPLESCRLFATSIAVQWESGGNLAPTLLTVERTIRDRIETERRIQAQAIESQASVLAVFVISYGLAYLMVQTNPEMVKTFFASPLGIALSTAVIFLQAIGIIWIMRMSQIRF